MSVYTKALHLKTMKNSIKLIFFFSLASLLTSCGGDYQAVELRHIKNVIADVSDDPMLKTEAVFYNPNDKNGKLKAINVDVYVEGKKAAIVKQKLKIKVPAKGEFTVPLMVKINLKEQGLMNTLLGVLGAKRLKVRYKGHVRISYHGLPIIVPVDHEEEIRIRF
ncbi:MAG: LEA type 2 family protein [Cyclobacteriaceae bacterium]|nr:LEA type 2 family protein [Cyclobacteriaceae bacterium]